MAKKKRRKRNRLATAATLLPLAIGLASNVPRAQPRPATTAAVVGGPMVVACTLPFDSIKQHHPIDDTCGPNGKAKPDSAQAAQNQAKNNFCATGEPVNIDFDVLHQLQKDAENQQISFGSDAQIPKDRSVLRSLPTKVGLIGEGTVGRIVAFVIKARYSNVGKGKGESVNCKLTKREDNDIHIVLGEKSNQDDECSSVTAEMSPHFRPEVWDPSLLVNNNAHLYRFTGQIFFDASHKPCSGGTGSPKRSSIWELHPVYKVEICLDPNNNCKVDSEENWVDFSDRVGLEGSSETLLRLPDGVWGELPFAAVPRVKSGSPASTSARAPAL
ncbi:MAG TPA: hypothetical protein VMT28_06770 [Terriglobales bacterium]|jgi:hypothetical protein|nr:hypothetical protein [Terriglobales bacterium]